MAIGLGTGRRVVAALSAVSVVAVLLLPSPVAQAQDPLPGSAYTPLTAPTRILDTRTDTGGHKGAVRAGETVNLAVPGVPDDATAVVLNVTGTGATSSTYLSVFPDQFVGTSTLNLETGQTAAVTTVVALGPKQTVNILNRSGTVEVVADLVGYFGTESGDAFTSTPSPTRILDTRTAVGGHQRPLGQGEELTLQVGGAGGVPTGATAVVLNLTGVTPSADTYLTVTPDGRAGTSSLNIARGTTRANLAVVAIGSDGSIRIRNAFGSTHVVADVQGWFAPGAGGRYVPLPVPRRVVDTRGDGGAIAAGGTRAMSFAGTGVPAGGRTAVLFSITGVRPSTDTYLTAWPQGRTRPLASNVNLRAGEIASNAAISDTSAINVYNLSGATNVVVDAAGYFYTPTTDQPTAPGAPAVTRVANAGDRVAVAWTAPADDGGLPVTAYTVTAEPGGLSVTVDGHRQSLEVAGLSPGVGYRFTVAATTFAGTGPSSGASAAVSPSSLSRVDTDAAGAPDQTDRGVVRELSGDGRYLLMTAPSNSPLVPPPHRTAADTGTYLLRKDVQTEEIVLAGVDRDGTALGVAGAAAVSADGTVVAYASAFDNAPSVLFLRDLTSQAVTEIATAPAGTAADRVSLSTDGQYLTWSARGAVYRQDLFTGETAEILNCPDPSTGCYLFDVGGVSDDAATVLLKYRPTPLDPIRLSLLDAGTGLVRPLPEGGQSDGFALSGDGRWVVYTLGSGGRFELKRVGTAPDAAAATLRSWEDGVTWSVYVSDVSTDGSVIGFLRQTGEDGQWYSAAPGYVLDGDRELRLPQARTNAYLRAPVLDANGGLALSREDCFFGEPCAPYGEFLLSLPELTR